MFVQSVFKKRSRFVARLSAVLIFIAWAAIVPCGAEEDGKPVKKILLVSSFTEVVKNGVFAKCIDEPLAGKSLTFIPAASAVEKFTFYVKAAKKAFEKTGVRVDVLDIINASREEVAATIEKNDLLYIAGGNTFFLLQELKKSGADKAVREHIRKGKLYIGESAGTIILAPDIEYAKDYDDPKKAPGLDGYDALKVLDFYPLPHYTEFPFKKGVEKIISENESLGENRKVMYPFTNKQALLIIGNKVTLAE